MTKSYLKYIFRQTPKLQKRFFEALEKIENGDLENLDLKKISGSEDSFRCRIGKFRIIFKKEADLGKIIEIDTRGDIY